MGSSCGASSRPHPALPLFFKHPRPFSWLQPSSVHSPPQPYNEMGFCITTIPRFQWGNLFDVYIIKLDNDVSWILFSRSYDSVQSICSFIEMIRSSLARLNIINTSVVPIINCTSAPALKINQSVMENVWDCGATYFTPDTLNKSINKLLHPVAYLFFFLSSSFDFVTPEGFPFTI